MKNLILIILMTLMLVGCGLDEKTADQLEAQETKTLVANAQKAVGGLPAITNYYEKSLLKEIYERRDQADLTTYAYTTGVNGKLTCLGAAIGYGVPYSTQYSNPMRVYRSGTTSAAFIPQPEPNGLFTPEGMSATWLQLVAPDGKIHVVYVEPTIVVSPFKITGPSVSAPC